MSSNGKQITPSVATQSPPGRSHSMTMYSIALLMALLGLGLLALAPQTPTTWEDPAELLKLHPQMNLIMAGRLLLAMGLTLAIGLERQHRQKPAGMRTMTMVGIGSCGFALAAIEFSGGNPDGISRMIQGIVTGIGFLGAGTIIKEQFHIEGLTTAATLWTVAGIGLTAGLGLYELTILLTLAAFVVLHILGVLDRSLPGRRRRAGGRGRHEQTKPE